MPITNVRARQIDMTKAKKIPYRRPEPSRATRKITSKSNKSGRMTITSTSPTTGMRRKKKCESLLEGNVLYLLESRTDVLDIWEQPPRFKYFCPNGKPRWCNPDFLVWMTSGLKLCVQVKPAAIVERTNFRAELECMRADMPLDYADELILITDRSFDAFEARNAARLNQFRSIDESDADRDLSRRLSALEGAISIADLIDGAPDVGPAFRAAFRAIFSGAARQVTLGDITPQTLIKKG